MGNWLLRCYLLELQHLALLETMPMNYILQILKFEDTIAVAALEIWLALVMNFISLE